MPDLESVHIMKTKKSIVPKLKFKTLTEQLTDAEFDQLLSKYRIQIGRENILKLICNGSSDSKLIALEGEILPIMQQRKPKNKMAGGSKSPAPKTHAITDLPTAMIGEIASHLDQKAYARLSTTNRKMFVDCNCPNRLVALDLDLVWDFRFISLETYRHLTSLEFAVADIDDFDYRLISRCQGLKTLRICGEHSGDIAKLRRFIINISGAFSGVTTLALHGFCKSLNGNPLPAELLTQLLNLFPALAHLKLLGTYFLDRLDTALLANCCPLLNRLSLIATNRVTSFLNAFGEQLTTLAMSTSASHVVLPNLDHSKLRRLCLYAPSQHTVDEFFKTSKNLEEICFVPLQRKGDTDVQPMNDLEIKRMTKKLIVDFKSLRFFHISTRGHFENICDSMQKALFCTSSREREFMEIALTVDCREITDFTDFMCSISRIIVGLTQSETEKWILSLHANAHRSFAEDQGSWEKAVSTFMKSLKTLNVTLLFAGKWKYAFGSEECSFLDTHHEWWNDCWQMDFY